MSHNNSIATLFEIPPLQWGLRGDPHLWEEMKSDFAQVRMPVTRQVLEKIIWRHFEKLTGEKAVMDKVIHVQRYPQQGMSGGYVSSDWWITTGVPLLLKRFEDGTPIGQ